MWKDAASKKSIYNWWLIDWNFEGLKKSTLNIYRAKKNGLHWTNAWGPWITWRLMKPARPQPPFLPSNLTERETTTHSPSAQHDDGPGPAKSPGPEVAPPHWLKSKGRVAAEGVLGGAHQSADARLPPVPGAVGSPAAKPDAAGPPTWKRNNHASTQNRIDPQPHSWWSKTLITRMMHNQLDPTRPTQISLGKQVDHRWPDTFPRAKTWEQSL